MRSHVCLSHQEDFDARDRRLLSPRRSPYGELSLGSCKSKSGNVVVASLSRGGKCLERELASLRWHSWYRADSIQAASGRSPAPAPASFRGPPLPNPSRRALRHPFTKRNINRVLHLLQVKLAAWE